MLTPALIRSGADALESLPPAPGQHEFLRDLVHAFAHKPHAISPKYFYDAVGSQLFDAICELPEYYPTRTELRILDSCVGEIAALAGPRAEIVEFGAGSLRKVRLLLDAFDRPARYVPLDISGDYLATSAATLRADYPRLEVQPVVADYTQRLLLPAAAPGAGRRIGFFPGSTLGNFTPPQALHFFEMTAQALRGGALLLGADLVKDPQLLHAAYNDSQGVTAAFNLNLLARANRELGTRFELEQFAHYAFYEPVQQRIEMHLTSRRDQRFAIGAQTFELREGDTLHTENSYKFTVEGLRGLARRAGFRPGPVWTDPDRLFSVHWLHAP